MQRPRGGGWGVGETAGATEIAAGGLEGIRDWNRLQMVQSGLSQSKRNFVPAVLAVS